MQPDKRNKGMSEKEKRKTMIEDEFASIIKDTQEYVEEYLEEDMEPEAMEACKKAAGQLAYRKKYYDVMKDQIVYFPSVARLIMKNDLQEEAEKHYYDDEDEFPPEYSKALKTVVREKGYYKESDNDGGDGVDNDEYMEKLAQDVESD